MSFSLRSAALVLAALSASSVAPAQVSASEESLIALNSPSLPKQVVPEPLPAEAEQAAPAEVRDPLAPVFAPGEEPAEAAPSKPKGDLASLVAQLRASDPGNRQLECLAVGIYFEAKSEPLVGQLAVGEVIANRAKSGRFASTYCGVLTQRGQFSFVRGGRWPSVAKSGRQWLNAVAVAKIVDQDLKDSAANKALFFHAKRVSPGWRLKRIAAIGNHIFYR